MLDPPCGTKVCGNDGWVVPGTMVAPLSYPVAGIVCSQQSLFMYPPDHMPGPHGEHIQGSKQGWHMGMHWGTHCWIAWGMTTCCAGAAICG